MTYFSKANDLAAMDSNGLSDPFVEIVLHKDLTLKTKTINKTVNPVWNEKFTLYIDDRSALANILVSWQENARKWIVLTVDNDVVSSFLIKLNIKVNLFSP